MIAASNKPNTPIAALTAKSFDSSAPRQFSNWLIPSSFSRVLARFFVFASVVISAGCQSGSPDNSLNLGNNNAQVPAVEKVGNGSSNILMILNRSGSSPQKVFSNGFRNGAFLAMQDLGLEYVTLTIADAKSSTEHSKRLLANLQSSNTKLIVVDGEPTVYQVVEQTMANSSQPIVVLGSDVPGKLYDFLPSGNDSLAASLSYSLDKGKRKIVAFVQANQKQNFDSMLRSVSVGRDFGAYEIPYGPSSSAKDIVAKHKDALSDADTIVFAGKDPMIIQLMQEIKASTIKVGNKHFVGRNDLSENIRNHQSMDGILIADIDRSSMQLIRNRYREKYGSAMPDHAAFSYDVVAICAGLSRVRGESGISAENLNVSSGFTGSTGSFRFKPDGHVERLYNITAVEGGKIKILKSAEKRFN